MRTQLNLSSKPFYNHRLFWIGVLAVFFVSLWLLLWMDSERSRVSAETADFQSEADALRKRNDAAIEANQTARKQQTVTVLDESQLRELAAARLLIDQKTFSWNRLLGDLETFMPKQARITGIRVTEIVDTGSGVAANIEIKAAGKSYAEMNEMMARIEESAGLFRIAGTAVQSAVDETGETPFTLNLIYSTTRGGAQ
jgi:Tfp pilus assembly protein PilN